MDERNSDEENTNDSEINHTSADRFRDSPSFHADEYYS